ncbi:hypothetical protein [Acinetobacter pseudolwoffii]|uniref:hypothetical protein n=1 Tax=Acinetobacter pseudolwoffii TaxID=2053287 RepID=UPI0024686F3D|nr:hypothetical protein [Acinetobacter pseudolwoffii]MDH5819003.1 hypothetical protein [Acinetobacter pseudolwoffii]
MKIISIGLVLLLAGCATADIIPIGANTYMISQTSAGGVFKAMGTLKAKVIQRANAFAESKGKIAVPVAEKETPSRPGQMPNYEYQFILVEKDDPRAANPVLKATPSTVILERR